MSLLISVLALCATFYQLYLQRVHNERSVRPFGQIDFLDRDSLLSVHVSNNGMGPLIVEKLTFIIDGNHYTDIEHCLDLDPRSYMHMTIRDSAKKVILPNAGLKVFEIKLEGYDAEQEVERIRRMLTPVTLKADCRDIYNNKVVVERDFQWFSRHNTEVSRQ
ncbi:hypothetical protein M0L20_07925 [Spirosoma sp. RP8]|uniref:Uncharacterized protein n=1 Tax=Spirosoma liriopis TaxID=2937440 RepID=A0ABT0HHY1_9BACT|nr:hypothetical protein [Spirosoma liriopis]MCK8491777.1 hypothetical protein [Spirosoma liriopis]